MLCLEALCFGNARDIGVTGFGLVAGFAENLEVVGFVIAAEGQGDDVINVPSLARVDPLSAPCAGTRLIEEQG